MLTYRIERCARAEARDGDRNINLSLTSGRQRVERRGEERCDGCGGCVLVRYYVGRGCCAAHVTCACTWLRAQGGDAVALQVQGVLPARVSQPARALRHERGDVPGACVRACVLSALTGLDSVLRSHSCALSLCSARSRACSPSGTRRRARTGTTSSSSATTGACSSRYSIR